MTDRVTVTITRVGDDRLDRSRDVQIVEMGRRCTLFGVEGGPYTRSHLIAGFYTEFSP